jgi:hypothetical protein
MVPLDAFRRGAARARCVASVRWAKGRGTDDWKVAMNSILIRSLPVERVERAVPAGRVLAIEPDARRANVLQRILRDPGAIELEMVAATEQAVRAIDERVPDLVITPALFPAAEEAVLAARIRSIPAASHVQIISVPFFLDADMAAPPVPSSNRTRFLRRRPASIRPRCDLGMVRVQILEYLERAVAEREERDEMEAFRAAAMDGSEEASVVPTPPGLGAVDAGRRVLHGAAAAGDRRRARRLRGEDVPTLWTVKLPWGSDARVVDISKSGVLLESALKISPGTTVDLRLLGEGTNLFVPARMVRAEVAAVDALGVRYRIAAAFSHELDLEGMRPDDGAPDAPSLTPRTLIDLMSRVVGDAERPATGAALRGRFEAELRRLLRLREARIRDTPVLVDRGAESVYFTLPGARPARILQAVYEPGYEPTATEFLLLKAAAGLAAVVLDLTTLSAAQAEPIALVQARPRLAALQGLAV